MSGYQLVPLPDREENAKILATLSKKYNASSHKRVTLNERFAVFEKGYTLNPVETVADPNETPIYFTIYERHLISKSDFIVNYLAHNPLKADSPTKSIESDKENSPMNKSRKSVSPSGIPVEKPFSPDAYIRDVRQSILNGN